MNANRSQGYVLVASIWLTLILLLLCGLFSSYAYTRFDDAAKSKLRTQDLVDAFSAEQMFLFVMATGIANRSGLSTGVDKPVYIQLDGRLYRTDRDTVFQVNDLGGLVGLNSLNNVHLENLLRFFESDPLVRNRLLDSLYDYIDLNSSPRLSGSEAPEYRVAGKRLPTNDYLKTPEELHLVYGWDDWIEAHPEFDLSWLSVSWRSRLNLNTAPEKLVAKVLPLPEQDLSVLLRARRDKPLSNHSEVERLLNMRSNLDEDFYTFLPLERVRMRIFSENDTKLHTIVITNTPLSLTAPWVIESRYQSERHFDIRGSVRSVSPEFFSR